MGSGAPLSLNWKAFFPRGKEKLRRKLCSQLEPELAVLSPKTGRHLVPADFLLNFIWLSKIGSFWADWQDLILFGCLTQFYLSSSHCTTLYLFFSGEKAIQNYCHSFPRLSCSFENSGSLEQSKTHGIRVSENTAVRGATDQHWKPGKPASLSRFCVRQYLHVLRACWKCRTFHPDPLNQNVHFNNSLGVHVEVWEALLLEGALQMPLSQPAWEYLLKMHLPYTWTKL